MEAAARALVGKERRPAALALAWQCWQVEDKALANHLLEIALSESKVACSTEMKLAGLEFLWQTAQYPTADQHLERLLADAELAKRPELWRFGVKLADQRDRKSRALECLERALELEAAQPPAVIDLESVREDYGRLLGHYQGLADAMITLNIAASDGFLAKVVRAADRWRAVDRDAAQPSNLAARTLQTLEERDLAWDYLTTPIATQPNEAEPWVALAGTLRTQGNVDLAELAYKAAAESEPTNAQILWDRAENLAASGQTVPAQRLFRQIAEGNWQPRFQGLRNQAKLRLR
jgi:Tfp pilus assembly protein PilF